ncbi:LamG-like jellyroll fold domain-containing protein [Pectobacterium punjabense]|uniref:LamG-like jellyroll fold domain-containing protein n=1 Tax=Pectobacterium punjabense TaxID=2108399 RepID=UPI00240568DA|nr:LamG-like jellyroll fold domain-containing protein [Pectobacterium punjabense]MDG0797504.1 alginate lyase family protein [Pectobacterium punjabense]
MKKILQQRHNENSNTPIDSHAKAEKLGSLPRRRFLQAGAGAAVSGLLGQFKGNFLTRAIAAVATGAIAPSIYAEDRTFSHPGLLHTEEDFSRIREKLARKESPWTEAWAPFIADVYSQIGASPRATETLVRGGDGQNFPVLYIDVQRSYRLAVRWKITQDTSYADEALRYLNAWSSTLKTITGNADRWLAAGIYGYQFANVAEIMRTYSGWAKVDLERFQNMMLTIFYPMSRNFLDVHNGADITNYWANWDQCAIANILAIGVLCDRPDIYQEALDYYKYGQGNGAGMQAVVHLHPGYLGQWQESGRDQGHTTLGMSLGVAFCEMAWNQGDDIYGYANNRFLAGAEYVAKSNLADTSGAYHSVPWKTYRNRHGWMEGLGTVSQGNNRPCWETIYNHYAKRKGIDTPYVYKQVQRLSPENGGGGDGTGYGTLLYTRELAVENAALKPTGLTAYRRGKRIELTWWGVVGATSYTLERSASVNGTFSVIAYDITDVLTYTDQDITTSATRYDYRVKAIVNGAETSASNTVSVAIKAEEIFHLAFNEGSGTMLADSTGKWGNSTLHGGATWGTGPDGSGVALVLDGIDGYVSLPGKVMENLGDFTVVTRFCADDRRVWARIFDMGSGTRRWIALLPFSNAGKMSFRMSILHGYMMEAFESTTDTFPLGRWVTAAMTMSDNVAVLYIDGTEVARSDTFTQAPYQLGELNAAYLGRSQYPTDPYMKGRYDYFKIYDGALSGSEIAALSR